MSDPLTTQYAVLAERRLHFGRMYWQNIGLHVAGLLAAAAIFRNLTGTPLAIALGIAGLATLLMAFIASRLRKLEVEYEGLLANIEAAWRAGGDTHVQLSPVSGRYGARFAVNLALAVGGVVLILLGLLLALKGGA
ncbi:MAG TPA: hypothetical protein VG407_11070 [Caulobacteraceae bacterium]|jgi:hypothetical protein|nr:hypothetical protein [Caulobacteraceae bacterium]